jgi:pyruvate-formate lyase-activating enzyme
MYNSIVLSYKHNYDPDELRHYRTSSVESESITVTLGEDFTWPAHVESFLRFLNQCGFVISEENILNITEACDNCVDSFSIKKEKDEPCDDI